jgi:uncharacterized Rmd1/YagE family protein
METNRLEVNGVYFPSPIDLDRLEKKYSDSSIVSSDPLVLRMPGDAYVIVFRLGAVVFWQCPETLHERIHADIRALPETDSPGKEVYDQLIVRVNQPEIQVNFRDICLQNLTVEHIKIISENFSKSIALRQFELSVSQALENTAHIVRALETGGEFVQSEKSVLKTVGFTMAVREAVLAKLSLFDDPVETSQSERLARLHKLLYAHFDIKKRLEGLSEKVRFLSELNLMLMSLLQTRTSHRLEWIVVLLIVIEVILSVLHLPLSSH